jgi:hypothetical protein
MSGIQFSSPVTNQKASPAVYASSLATRPAPQLPGRIFVDTDNPSTGMYRDTGTVWVQISLGTGSIPDLQTVCNVGFVTDTDMTFSYDNSLETSKIGFYNIDVSDFTFDIFKKANELFSIRALKPSTVNEEMELIFDAPGNTIKTNYNSLERGLKLDFVTEFYSLGQNYNGNGSVNVDITNNEVSIMENSIFLGTLSGNQTQFVLNDAGQFIETRYSSNTNGLKLDFASNIYKFGNFASGTATQRGIYIDAIGEVGIGNQNPTYLLDVTGTARVSGTELRLDNGTTGTINIYTATPKVNFFSGGGYSVGRTSTTLEVISGGTIIQYIGANQAYQIDATNGHLLKSAIAGSASLARLTTGGNFMVGTTTDSGNRMRINGSLRIDGQRSGSSGGASGQHLIIDCDGTQYKIQLLNP